MKNELRLGIIAGNGNFPLEIARTVKAQGAVVVAVGHKDETAAELEKLTDAFQWIRVGELGKIIKFFHRHKIQQVVFAGGIRRVKLFGGVKLDLRGLSLIARLGSVKDDVLMRGVAEELEKESITVVSGSVFLPESAPPQGPLTVARLTDEEKKFAKIGWEACETIGTLDIGQTVVVNGGIVVAVEAIEGTDQAILRGGALSGKGAIVVKLPKPQQDLRFDLPAVGVTTIESLRKAGARGLVLKTKCALLLDPSAIIQEANQAGIAIEVFDSVADLC